MIKKRVAWNKGLTKETDDRVKKNNNKLSSLKKSLSHIGKKHSKTTKEKIGLAHKGRIINNKWKEKISNTLKEKYASGKIFKYWLGKHHSKKVKEKISKVRKKNGLAKLSNNSNWQGGKSFEPYGLEFNDILKGKIRKRDNYTCQQCSIIQKKPKLDVHHKNINKQDNKESNLISLCHYCHITLHNKLKKKQKPKQEVDFFSWGW